MDEGTFSYLGVAVVITIFFIISLSPKNKINSDGRGGKDDNMMIFTAVIVAIAWVIFFARLIYVSIFGVSY